VQRLLAVHRQARVTYSRKQSELKSFLKKGKHDKTRKLGNPGSGNIEEEGRKLIFKGGEKGGKKEKKRKIKI